VTFGLSDPRTTGELSLLSLGHIIDRKEQQ